MPTKKRIRRDGARTIKKVAREFLRDPLQSQKEIAAKLGVCRKTVDRAKASMSQDVQKSEKIITIIDKDREIIEIGQRIIKKTLVDIQDKKVEINDARTVSGIIAESTKRYSLFRGSSTDENGGLKENSLTVEQQKAIARLYLNPEE